METSFFRLADKQSLIVEEGCELHLKDDCLLLKKDGAEHIFSFEFLSSLMLGSQKIFISTALLNALVIHHIKVIFVDVTKKPSAMLLPYLDTPSNGVHFREQLAWEPKRIEALWVKILTDKLNNQRLLLKRLDYDVWPFSVQSIAFANCDIVEARAARFYFQRLFGSDFCRRDEKDPINDVLNYGYAILLSEVGQDVAALGYHPALGIHHCAATNPFNLASDLMEPFRPIIDRLVKENKLTKLDMFAKKMLVGSMREIYRYHKKKRKLEDIIAIYVRESLAFISGKSKQLPGVAL